MLYGSFFLCSFTRFNIGLLSASRLQFFHILFQVHFRLAFYDEIQKTDQANVAGKPEVLNEQWQSKFLQKKTGSGNNEKF